MNLSLPLSVGTSAGGINSTLTWPAQNVIP
jgi:hypothetical protein